MAWPNVLFMEPISDIDHATAVANSVCAGLDAVRGTAFWKIGDDDLLSLAETLERVGRLVYAAQVHLTGEIDTRRVFQDNGAVSTAALLRQRLCISPGDAAARVRAARAILPRDLPSGGESPPELPELRAAVDAGAVGTEQIRTVVSTMRALPADVDPGIRDMARASLAANAQVTEPVVFARFAQQVADRCDPDGTLDQRDPVDKVELTLGSRNMATGLTGFKGFLDDLGVEVLSKAIDGLAAPRPAADGIVDPRPAKVRRGHALVEVLRRFLDVGFAPTQGRGTPARHRHHGPRGAPRATRHGGAGSRRPDHRRAGTDAGLRRDDHPRRPGVRLAGAGHGHRGPVGPLHDPPGDHPAGPRMHLPGLRPARDLVRFAPCHPLVARRTHQLQEWRAAVPTASPAAPSR